MGTVVKIPKSVGDSPIIPAGRYGEEQEATVVQSRERDVPGDQNTGSYWDLSVAIRQPNGSMHFVRTSPFAKNNTQLEPNTQSKAHKFAVQLGIPNPETEFEIEKVMGASVLVDVGLREWTPKGTDDKRSQNEIENIWMKS